MSTPKTLLIFAPYYYNNIKFELHQKELLKKGVENEGNEYFIDKIK